MFQRSNENSISEASFLPETSIYKQDKSYASTHHSISTCVLLPNIPFCIFGKYAHGALSEIFCDILDLPFCICDLLWYGTSCKALLNSQDGSLLYSLENNDRVLYDEPANLFFYHIFGTCDHLCFWLVLFVYSNWGRDNQHAPLARRGFSRLIYSQTIVAIRCDTQQNKNYARAFLMVGEKRQFRTSRNESQGLSIAGDPRPGSHVLLARSSYISDRKMNFQTYLPGSLYELLKCRIANKELLLVSFLPCLCKTYYNTFDVDDCGEAENHFRTVDMDAENSF